MDEYISRPSLMGRLTCSEAQSRVREMTGEEVYAWVLELVNGMPAEDVVPVRHGRWIEYENEADKGFHYCSECKGQAFNYEECWETVEVLSLWCPNCGAKMMEG